MFGVIARLFSRGPARRGSPPPLEIVRVASHAAYVRHLQEQRDTAALRRSVEVGLLPETPAAFAVRGCCFACGVDADFVVDFEHAYVRDRVLMPNWRERLVCPGCRLNSRMRAAVHIFEQECRPARRSRIYLTEQTTALHAWLRRSFPRLVGSEFLGAAVERGSCDAAGIRNEDLTRLSFGSGVFDYVLSFDVLEHIPDYRKALAECFRCLSPGGTLILGVPFVATAPANIVLARVSASGEVTHLKPPEYHGDPLRAEGCLCFQRFGWELLDELAAAGFRDPEALLYWSREYGYLGGEQVLLTATKPR